MTTSPMLARGTPKCPVLNPCPLCEAPAPVTALDPRMAMAEIDEVEKHKCLFLPPGANENLKEIDQVS